MNEFDQRQLNIMLIKIEGFNTGYLHLSDLIYDLEALLNILEEKDKNWEAAFRNYWWDLEQVYAVSIENDQVKLDPEDQSIIKKAIDDLTALIQKKLNSIENLEKD
jgi:hypothetical protein